jgi:hypothetical protein
LCKHLHQAHVSQGSHKLPVPTGVNMSQPLKVAAHSQLSKKTPMCLSGICTTCMRRYLGQARTVRIGEHFTAASHLIEITYMTSGPCRHHPRVCLLCRHLHQAHARVSQGNYTLSGLVGQEVRHLVALGVRAKENVLVSVNPVSHVVQACMAGASAIVGLAWLR